MSRQSSSSQSGGYANRTSTRSTRSAPKVAAAPREQPVEHARGTSMRDVMEPNVLPVFYYNDLLVANIGEPMGLNLFEPRYKIMCQKMQFDPRFLFVPNFDDYHCCVGDVGFVIQVSHLQQQRGGQFGIQGYAVACALIECNWVEPDTNGLHMAKFKEVGKDDVPLDTYEFRTLLSVMNENEDWGASTNAASNGGARIVFQHRNLKGKVIFTANCPERHYAILHAPQDPEPIIEELGNLWSASIAQLQNTRIDRRTFCKKVLSIREIKPNLMRPTCAQFRSEFAQMIELDSKGVLQSRQEMQNLDQVACRKLRVASVIGMSIEFSSAFVEVVCTETSEDAIRLIAQSLPRMRHLCERDVEHPPHKMVALISNSTTQSSNVFFFAPIDKVELMEESFQAALGMCRQRLNWPRARLLWLAQRTGVGPLGILKDDIIRDVCVFLMGPPNP
eukprot:gnl/MRDRNA2_/MRDRNA2_24241_c0_seq1.p1 gnl/MRDRNA2_/MRDRNA2_24241_c0~~gnl/MRDRNA2_/MRDRNA2_24241_c0_seq1.p1  ORF type:complete len:447 (+),score=74.29 gnl/MRDRNA2_/MRDRNA2_24241_c0_seq1:89-1429(+)